MKDPRVPNRTDAGMLLRAYLASPTESIIPTPNVGNQQGKKPMTMPVAIEWLPFVLRSILNK